MSLRLIAITILIFIIAYLVCIFVGGVILAGLGIPLIAQIGGFIEQYAVIIAALCAAWYFFTRANLSLPR